MTCGYLTGRRKKPFTVIQEFDGNCARCGEELDLPLYCRECKIWLCSNCHLSHDVEVMKERGLLKCPCGEDHD